MKLRRPKRREEPESIILLINIVFLLLAFFMLAGRLAESELLEVRPPASDSTDAAQPSEIVVLLAADGRLALGGALVEESQLPTLIRQRAGDGAPPRVVLKADAAVEAGRVIAVMETLRGSGLEQIVLLTKAAS